MYGCIYIHATHVTYNFILAKMTKNKKKKKIHESKTTYIHKSLLLTRSMPHYALQTKPDSHVSALRQYGTRWHYRDTIQVFFVNERNRRFLVGFFFFPKKTFNFLQFGSLMAGNNNPTVSCCAGFWLLIANWKLNTHTHTYMHTHLLLLLEST